MPTIAKTEYPTPNTNPFASNIRASGMRVPTARKNTDVSHDVSSACRANASRADGAATFENATPPTNAPSK